MYSLNSVYDRFRSASLFQITVRFKGNLKIGVLSKLSDLWTL